LNLGYLLSQKGPFLKQPTSSVFGLLPDVIEGAAATIKDPRVDQLEGVVDRIATEWVLDESLERR
jgi:hypothetical protein